MTLLGFHYKWKFWQKTVGSKSTLWDSVAHCTVIIGLFRHQILLDTLGK